MNKTASIDASRLKINKILNITLLIFTSILIFLPSFFRGLYFEKEQFIVYIFSAILFVIYCFFKIRSRQKIMFATLLDYAVAAMVAMYLINFITSIHPRAALGELLKYINYLVIYLLVCELCVDLREIKVFLNIILASGFGVSLLGIAAACGTLKINGAYSEVEHMISSTLQYHNTFAALTVVNLFIAFTLYSLSENKYFKLIYSIVSFTLFFTLIFSYSRGVWLLFPLVFLVYIILGYKLILKDSIILMFSIGISTALSMKGFGNSLVNKEGLNGWFWFFTGLIACIILTFLIELLAQAILKLNINPKVAGITIAAIALFGVLAIAFVPGLAQKVVPLFILERARDINLSTHAVQERFAFYIDGFKIIKDFPIFGVGGGGWPSIYFKYQSYLYWSTQPHSYIMQVLIENGVLGLAALIFLGYSFIKICISNFKLNKENAQMRIISLGITMAASSILLHSIIDFDLSLSAISIILWSMLAIISSIYSLTVKENVSPKAKRGAYRLSPYAAMIAGILFLFITSSLIIANTYAMKGIRYVKANNYKEAVRMFKIAKSFDPLNVSYRVDYANLLFDTAVKNEKDNSKREQVLKEVNNNMETALSLDRYSSKINAQIAAYYMRTGRIDEGLRLIEKSIELQPLRPENYLQKADAYLQVAQIYLNKREKDKAKEALRVVVNIEGDIAKINQRVLKPVELNEKTRQMIARAKEVLDKI